MDTVELAATGRMCIPEAIRNAGRLLPGAGLKVSLIGAAIRIRHDAIDRVGT